MSAPIEITHHAAERYVERIDPSLTLAQAYDAIATSARAVRTAAGFGCGIVRQATGAKLILEGDRVVTVIADERRRFPVKRGVRGRAFAVAERGEA